jgi:hypothetical protein
MFGADDGPTGAGVGSDFRAGSFLRWPSVGFGSTGNAGAKKARNSSFVKLEIRIIDIGYRVRGAKKSKVLLRRQHNQIF